ncbi:MAG: GTPase HflX [Myxococcota bacterium]|nr:GTPase HflX [Myxococcota bacterium]
MAMLDEERPDQPRRAVLCAVQTPEIDDTAFHESLVELARLSQTLGLEVVGQVVQRRVSAAAAAYLGPGRLEDLARLVREGGAPTVVVVDHEITPSQARNIEKATGAAAVLDRTALILEIFHRHARSRAARLQVEIVRLSYMAPRLRESLQGRDRQRGLLGGRGPGESQLELDRRKIRDRMAELRAQLAQIRAERKVQRARRQGLRRVALCGYTNAGKSTLFRALTGADVYIADRLFATLDTTVRALSPEVRPRILVSDTIGFVRNLPTRLVESFRSTLEEATEASLILHVVDASDRAWPSHMATTNEVLAEIGAGAVPQILVFNKIDRLPGGLPEEVVARYPGALALSALRSQDVLRLRQAVLAFFERDLVESELILPYHLQQLRAEVFATCQVLAEEPEETGVRFRLRAPQGVLDQLRVRASLPRLG